VSFLVRLGLAGVLATAFALSAYFVWAGRQPVQRGVDTFVVAPGSGVGQVARALTKQGVLREPYTLIVWAYARGATRAIRSGEYQLAGHLTVRELLDQLTAGKVKQYAVTIVEGWTFKQVKLALAQAPKLSATFSGLSDEEIMTAIGYAGQHPEGRFFPDSYFYVLGTVDRDVLKRAHESMARRLAQAWEQRAENLAINTSDEALVLASLIEKETARDDERQLVSAVLHNRLRQGMRLQIDPTVIYGLGDSFNGNLTRTHLAADNPYNTYTRNGLPPTPIAMPGEAALRAAVHPADSSALYFVARRDGSHEFSETLEQHNKAVIKYQLGGKPRPFSSYPAAGQTKTGPSGQ